MDKVSRYQFVDLLGLVRPFYAAISKGVLIGPVIGLMTMIPPYLSKLLFDQVAQSYDVSLMLMLVLGIFLFSVTSVISESILSYYSSYLNIKIESTVLLHFLNHIQHLPLSFFYERKVGEIVSRFQEVKLALGSVTSFIGVFFGQGFYLLVVPPFLFILSWKLAVVALLTIPLSSLFIYWLGDRLRTSWKSVVERHAEVDADKVEMISQIYTLKSMQLESHFYKQLSGKMTGILDAHMRAQWLNQLFLCGDKSVGVLNIALLTLAGWYLIILGEMTIGDFVAFLAYVAYLRGPFKELIAFIANFQQWSVHLNRLFEFLNIAPESDPDSVFMPRNYNFTSLKSSIRFDNVSFDYPSRGPLLTAVSLEVHKGELVSLMGASGCGKSTVVRLLGGMETGFNGGIYVDNFSIRDMSISELRSRISVVLQDTQLFQGSIFHNITIGSDQIDLTWFNYIVGVCCLKELIASLPAGAETAINTSGLTLSGGQRQRLALARALFKNKPILIIDEGLSALDVETEKELVANLINHVKKFGITTMLITHKLSIAQCTEKVYVMNQGIVIGPVAAEMLSRAENANHMPESNQKDLIPYEA